MSKKYLDSDGLLYLWSKVKTLLGGKVDKAEGKGLSANDYTAEEKAAVGANTAARHSHTNQTVLDGVSAAKVTAWDGKLDKSGGTLTGALTLSGAPTADLHAATKKYVDGQLAAAGTGDMLKSVYDADGDGVVDNAKQVNGHTVSADVPAGAKFTDTTYAAATAGADGLMSKADYSKLSAFGAASTYALKSDITSMYKYKGSKASVSALPATGNAVGDVWNVEDTGMNYGWTGSEWDALGEVFEIASITNAEIDTIAV